MLQLRAAERLPLSLSLLLLLLRQAAGSENLCDTVRGRDCCPGWTRNEAGLCKLPICTGNCGSAGVCISANLCYCGDGSIRYSCGISTGGRPGGASASNGCGLGCFNGGRCVAGRCRCSFGFTGDRCDRSSGSGSGSASAIFSCPSGCSGHGRCLATGRCSCDIGFAGDACDSVQKGPCYSEINNGMCSALLTSQFISRELCCNSFGKAWGHSCSRCTASRCGIGRVAAGRGGCVAIDYCSISGICGAGTCKPHGARDIRCRCRSGETFNSKLRTCEVKSDYCKRHAAVCGAGGKCVNQGDSYVCQCFTGYLLASNAKYCIKNPCSNSSLCQYGSCSPTANGADFSCKCDTGFDASPDGRSCSRRTYCTLNPLVCGSNGTCIPNDDFYFCRCNAGFQVAGNGLGCLAVTTATTPASTASSSTTTSTSTTSTTTTTKASLSCSPGWKLAASGDSCEPAPMADAPANVGASCWSGACSNGRCIPVGSGDFRCSCFPGFDISGDGRSCQPQLYCRRHSAACANGRCISLSADRFICECKDGFLKAEDGMSCVSAGSSASSINPCLAFEICRNGMCRHTGKGSFQCVCYHGYEPTADMQHCRRRRFCAANTQACGNAGRCVDVGDGDYRCACHDGFQAAADARSCRRVNQRPAAAAQQQQQQQQHTASYCQRFGHVCGDGQCVDLRGSHSFTCACSAGYRLAPDKRHCVKAAMRETGVCAERPMACNAAGHCINYGIGYQCFCYPGFRHATADRRNCVPYDYNREFSSIGIHGADMNDILPSHKQKQQQQQQSQKISISGSISIIENADSNVANLQMGDSPSPSAAAASSSSCSALGNTVCKPGSCYDAVGGFKCHCDFGFEPSEDERSCVDVNECTKFGEKLCLMGECVNTVGSFTCHCKPGFRLDASTRVCVDRNECVEDRNLCENGRCKNIWGSYECSCWPGFKLESTTRQRCLPQPAVIQIDGSIEVHNSMCPDCLRGCRFRSDFAICRCPNRHRLIQAVLCIPDDTDNVQVSSSSSSIHHLSARLPVGSAASSVRAASRKVDQLSCRIDGLEAGSILIECSFSIRD